MPTNRLAKLAWTFAGAFCFLMSSSAFADCQSEKPATNSDIAGGQADVLLKAMISACKTQDSSKFFSLQTRGANISISKLSPTEKSSLFNQYCAFTNDAVNKLGGNLTSAIHSIGPYKNKQKCGMPSSYWHINTKDGQLALRLEVAVESGNLRIDTH